MLSAKHWPPSLLSWLLRARTSADRATARCGYTRQQSLSLPHRLSRCLRRVETGPSASGGFIIQRVQPLCQDCCSSAWVMRGAQPPYHRGRFSCCGRVSTPECIPALVLATHLKSRAVRRLQRCQKAIRPARPAVQGRPWQQTGATGR